MKGPYVITEIKLQYCTKFKIERKKEVIHQNRIKLCQDRNNPSWLSRFKNQILKYHYITDTFNSEFDELNLDTLFKLPENGELFVAVNDVG